jgi:hypothetical protein
LLESAIKSLARTYNRRQVRIVFAVVCEFGVGHGLSLVVQIDTFRAGAVKKCGAGLGLIGIPIQSQIKRDDPQRLKDFHAVDVAADRAREVSCYYIVDIDKCELTRPVTLRGCPIEVIGVQHKLLGVDPVDVHECVSR